MLGETENTEEKIIKAAFKILQIEGAAKATTKKIAAEAGVNEVTIFRKFDNKKNLVEVTKQFYMDRLLEKLEDNFSFTEDESIEDYLKSCFYGMFNFTDDDFSIIKVAMQEVRDVPDRKLLISQITSTILGKLEEFFKLQLEKGIIKDINSKAVSIMCFSIIFQSLVLWQIYGSSTGMESDYYAKDFLNIIFNGIKH
ncbi:TetR/AcrR family transcriptional regulator [uncultured Methanobrevibacter sp.]|uniref:TetR/AcrR family transcriptional regulator n=1 Tax=uncultured Methanobrevibacter sp. TaxID=253161 RepID=UPI0025EADDAB|nr:TetR/AcrR family transcriptional regulator [uncultured Methanobrevibacter sp.]